MAKRNQFTQPAAPPPPINVSGIYMIKNINNNKLYIGSSKNIAKRWERHKYDLNKNRHPNSHLQNAWNKYGKDSFIFEIVEKCKEEDLIIREELNISILSPQYNKISIINGQIIFSEESKNRMSESAKKKIFTEEHRKNMSNSRKNKKLSEDTKQKISLSNSGKTIPLDTRKKISDTLKSKSEINPNAKLNWEKVYEIRDLYKDGYKCKELMELYNIGETAIYSIVNNKSWRVKDGKKESI